MNLKNLCKEGSYSAGESAVFKGREIQRSAGGEERARLLAAFLGASTTPISSPRPSTPPIDSPGPSKNTKYSNCKLLIGKIKVLEAKLEMHMHLEQHTHDSTALLHEVYNDMGKLGLE
ncbi:hypothetical protein Tco_1368981 [Tanacetum coccineum]